MVGLLSKLTQAGHFFDSSRPASNPVFISEVLISLTGIFLINNLLKLTQFSQQEIVVLGIFNLDLFKCSCSHSLRQS